MLGDLDSLAADKDLQDPLRALPDARKLLIAFLGSCGAPKYEDYIAAVEAVTDWYLKQRDAKRVSMPRRMEFH